MKVLAQRSSDRDCIGITNAMLGLGHEITLWNPDEAPIGKDHDLYLFTDSNKLGYESAKHSDKHTCIFIKCKQPSCFKNPHRSIESMPVCADTMRFPAALRKNEYASRVCYISNYKDRTFELSHVKQNDFIIVGGVPINLPNYIGRLDSPQEFSEFALSAELCIDFYLEMAVDLAKLGARVITSSPNDLGIPTFQLENINDVIDEQIKAKKPILNPYNSKILSYMNFISEILRATQ